MTLQIVFDFRGKLRQMSAIQFAAGYLLLMKNIPILTLMKQLSNRLNLAFLQFLLD
jgi:hypothetical protein